MAFCTRCGRQIEEGAVCGCSTVSVQAKVISEKIEDTANRIIDSSRSVVAQVKTGLTDNQPRVEDTRQDTVTLSEGEIIIRKYICSKLNLPKCYGSITVTNHRVVFHGHANNSRLINEVPLDSVAAISSFYGTKWRLGRLVFGILLAIGGCALFHFGEDNMAVLTLGFVILALGFWLIIKSPISTFILKVYSSKANNTPIDIGSGLGTLGGKSALFSVIANPTDQTDVMMLELGAMIGDLQRMGDLGAQKWME